MKPSGATVPGRSWAVRGPDGGYGSGGAGRSENGTGVAIAGGWEITRREDDVDGRGGREIRRSARAGIFRISAAPAEAAGNETCRTFEESQTVDAVFARDAR